MEVRDVDALEQWWRPGAMPRWITLVLAAATVTTVAVTHLAGHHFGAYFYLRAFWLRDGIALGLAAVVAAGWLPRWQLSRALRVAIVLPLAQLAAVAAAWTAWRVLAPRMPMATATAPFVGEVPLELVVVVAATATAMIARAIAGRRRGEWMHAAVMLALVHLLLAGLWLPIAAQLWTHHERYDWWTWQDVHDVLAHRSLLVLVLVPPLAAATAFTALAIRCHERVHRWRHMWLAVALALVLVAIATRTDPRHNSPLVYVNFIHVLLALAIVAAGSLGVFALATWLRAREARRRLSRAPLRGTVVHDGERGEPIACLQIAGWLRGPRALSRAFTVATPDGILAVPGDAGIVADLPAVSTRLETGDAIAVLRTGDRVVLAGYVAPPADHPFRTSAAPVPGPHGILIAREQAERGGFAAIALASWRPCIAYLIVVVAIALPGLAAAYAAH